jgi:predicted permease
MNLVLMAQLHGGHSEATASLLFFQYCMALLTAPLALTVFMAVLV